MSYDPSCLVCGQAKPFGVWHIANPEIGVCKDCKNAATELANRKADIVSARVEREIYTFQNKKLREQLHRSMQLFGNLTLELKKNAAYREMLAVTEAAISEAAILENVSRQESMPGTRSAATEGNEPK